MFWSDRSAVIAAPPAQVWARLVEFERWGPWLEQRDEVVLQLVLGESSQIGMGAGRPLTLSDDRGFSQPWAVKDWQPQAQLVLAALPPHQASVKAVLTALPDDRGTKVDLRLEFDGPSGFAGWVAGIMGLADAADIHADAFLDGLKAAAEGR